MSEPTAFIRPANTLLSSTMRMPDYQRDFVWKYEMMQQLWDDFINHLKTSQVNEKIGRYYLGSIVIDTDSEKRNVVDGQQRFTTLTIISAAVRDALIASGHVKQAFTLDEYLLNDHTKFNDFDPDRSKRFMLLDEPPGDVLSSEYRLACFRQRIVPIPLPMETVSSKKGEKVLRITNLNKKSRYPWTVAENEQIPLIIYDQEDPSNHIAKVFVKKGEGMIENGHLPKEYDLISPLPFDIPDGLKVLLAPEIKWPISIYMEVKGSAKDKANLNMPEFCGMFDKSRREFYFAVRSEAEHFILGQKRYFSQIQNSKKDVKNISLFLDNNLENFQLQRLARNDVPEVNKHIKLIKKLPIPPNKIPEEAEIVNLIKSIRQSGGQESQTLELKATLRYNLVEYGLLSDMNSSKNRIKLAEYRKLENSDKKLYKKVGNRDPWTEFRWIKVVSSFINTRGGALIIGVRDNGQIKGIEIDEFNGNWDKAEMYVSNKIDQYLGTTASGLVMPKVVMVEGVPVMYILIRKWSSKEDPPDCKVPDKTTAFFGRTGSSQSKKLSPSEKSSWIMQDYGTCITELDEPAWEELDTYFLVKDSRGNDGNIQIEGEISSESDSQDIIYSRSYCDIPYLPQGKVWPDHLDSEGKRAEQLVSLTSNVIFSVVQFTNDPATAIDYFMITNDAARMHKLTVYDMAAAFTQKIIRPKKGMEMNTYQKIIKSKWYEFSKRVYLSAKKESSLVSKFFYYYLMASRKKKTPSSRWEEKDSWTGLRRHIERNYIYHDGEFDYQGLQSLYEEMNDYSKIFVRGLQPDSSDWNSEPYDKAEMRDERTYLKILSKASIKQHLPIYMSLAYACDKKDKNNRATIVRGFLKNWVYVWLRYRAVPKLQSEGKNGFVDSKMYGIVSGKEGWIEQIHDSIGIHDDATHPDDMTYIQNLPLELEPEHKDKSWPWKKDLTQWEELNKGQPKHSNDICVILFAFERASEGQTNPTMARIHGSSKPQIEHVLPEKPENWGETWYDTIEKEGTAAHREWVYALGNHIILEDSKNSHVRNLPFEDKVPLGGSENHNCPEGKEYNHYEGSDFKSTEFAIDEYQENGKWDQDSIKANATETMNALIEFFPAT